MSLWQDQVVEVRYCRWAPEPGEVARLLHPLGLGRPRTYRVSAIAELRPLPDKSTRPDGWQPGRPAERQSVHANE